jgi:hypothetical protein
MDKQGLLKGMNINFRIVFITTLCCSAFWIITGIVCYRYIVKKRIAPDDSNEQMMVGFYKRDVKIKMDSISNALMIQTLRHQLVEKQILIDSLGDALAAERLNSPYDREYRSDEHMMFMKMNKHHARIPVPNSKDL